ncbi:unnamed protein product [Adineta ricciae]|uniref:PLAT domain-containing protein n=1 Tax=Adineta ricciae TaxID=249248 RepID=A0A815LHS3_ADIRI|nr:unnamed protein product [Adineta ricciae]
MSCCFGKDTTGKDPQKSISEQSESPANRPIIQVSKPTIPRIEYSITVKTGDFRNSGTNGPVYINIFSRDNKQTGDVLLTASDKSFLQGSTRKFQITAIDIGKPQRVIVRHEDKVTGWYIDYVEISVHNFLVRFVANRWLNHLKNDRKLEAELFGSEQPAVFYDIEVETGEQQVETLDSPVYIQVYGATTATPKLFLEAKNAAFKKDSISKFNVSSNNVGEIERIVIGHEGLGTTNDWHLKSVKILVSSQSKKYAVDTLLSPTLNEKRLFIELPIQESQSPSPPPAKYLIAIQTSDVPQAVTTDSVEIIVRGSNGQIPKTLLKDHAKMKDELVFQEGNIDEFEIEHSDIGTIESVTIGFSDSQQTVAWLLESIIIQYQETIYQFQPQCWLSSRLGSNFSWITIEPGENNRYVNYKVIIVTGESGIDANVILCIFGEKDTTANLPLRTTKDGSPAKFHQDSTLEFDIRTEDVGKITKINIGHDGNDSKQQWFLKSIHIEKKDEQYSFQANRWLSVEKDDQKTYINLVPDEPISKKDQAKYLITIVTGSGKDAGTDSGVFMVVEGDKDQTERFQLVNTKRGEKALFESGTTNEFEMELDDVGNINRIMIEHDGQGDHPQWHLESVQIKKGSDQYNFIANRILDQTTPLLNLTPTPTKATPSPELIEQKPSRSTTPIKEMTYTVSIQTSSTQKDEIKDPANVYLILYGEDNQTERLYLNESTETCTIRPGERNDFQFKTTDVGKISKIVIGHNDSDKQFTWHIDHVIINGNITFNAEQTLGPNSELELRSSTIPKKTEITYEVFLRTGAYHQEGSASNIYLTIFGKNGQTTKVALNKITRKTRRKSFKTDDEIEFEFKAHDVGKISKIILSQNPHEEGIKWHIDRLTIIHNNEKTTFHIQRKNTKTTEIELIPLAKPKQTESPRRTVKITDPISKTAAKMKEIDYHIVIETGEQGIDTPVTLKVHGEKGSADIPLKGKDDKTSFPSKSINEFTSSEKDVGKIYYITLALVEKKQDVVWHLKKVQLKKGSEEYNFDANVRLDRNDNKVNLYLADAVNGHPGDDYVQSELRRLRENLRCESSKLHRPQHKPHEPFVFNDLRPYFDTSTVERAIYSHVNIPPGYYTRVTALRIVEPWEAYGMDYGVNYEYLRHRKTRSLSGKPPPPKPDNSTDRKQGSTHLPPYPRVDMRKPAEYSGPLTVNDIPKIRNLVRTRYTSQADSQREKDYQRTHNDLYRMQLDNVDAYHKSNRDNMLRVYHSYLENTPGSKKALRELCDQLSPKTGKSDVKNAA